MVSKSKVTVPFIIKDGGSSEEAAVKAPAKESEMAQESGLEAETFIQIFGRVEDRIQELNQMLAEMEDMKRLGLGGSPEIPPKDQGG